MLSGQLKTIADSIDGNSMPADMATPAFVFDYDVLKHNIREAHYIAKNAGCELLYSIKACAIPDVLTQLSDAVSGFSCSSFFEAKLARDILKADQTVHFTSPGIRQQDYPLLVETCDFVSANTLKQLALFSQTANANLKIGLRINPELSLVEDTRYDPCRKHSKLGVPIGQLVDILAENPRELNSITGLHFHTNCDSESFLPLLQTVRILAAKLPGLLDNVDWVNLGGGYYFDREMDCDTLAEAVEILSAGWGVKVYVEPGGAIVRNAGSVVTTVVDMISHPTRNIAILDTTVNHMPEVFEYQYQPEVATHCEDGPYEYILAGGSCLAGDLFGQYCFHEPLQIGSRIVFQEIGAYSVVKAHMFNGINLPEIYSCDTKGNVALIRRFDYSDFFAKCGGVTHAVN